ncbi:hypothetical protein TTHERM_00185930 (macronuclear) [Tetrahymena thermophila SB210]|uniref:Uncharacterized protein n=1 Tax=Tetrahymena thermophila (strain SB210) TaxID=312017 RepID=Q22T19_TETTS|nr:hypothetical protein TTHERM_00185930 [Tetrahymena thermophila SB210]EAR88619.2 hypothetical protein TTHERM_00185930 [Tetrahymena thermophila SB210]|eukprot:XP_001008864.2 hypothetical protein TTHERM_00185930 [Tetrahymena thermophila SB210]
MSKNPNQPNQQNQNPVKKAEPQLAKDAKGNAPQPANAQQPQKNDGKQPQQQPGKAAEPNKTNQAQANAKDQQKSQAAAVPNANKQQEQNKQQQQQQQLAAQQLLKQQQEANRQLELQKQQELAEKNKLKLEKKQKKHEYMKQQKEYFDQLYRAMQVDNMDDLVEGKDIVLKVDKTNVKRIEYGIQSIEGLIFRKGHMIEEDQIDELLLEALKERDSLQSQILYANQVIKDCENQLIEIPKTISATKKPSIVEEAVLEKRIVNYKKEREDYEKKLKEIEKKIKNLQSQRIENPRSAYSHAGLKAYLEQQDSQKRREASTFIKKVQEDKKVFEEKIKKIESEQQAKQLQEEQDKLAKEARLKIMQDKEKEEQLKKRIKDIEQEKAQRTKELEQHEEKYKQLKERMNNGKQPLYQRLNKQFRSQQKLEEKEKLDQLNGIKENHKRIDEMNLFEHQQKYLDKLKQQEEDRIQDRKKRNAELKEHLQKVSSFPVSTMWSQSKEEVSFNSPQDQKLRALKIVEARNNFADGVKKKKKVHLDSQKRLEIQIKIDKLNNPSKYIKPIRRRNSNDSQQEISEDYDKFDEKVYKNEIKFERGKNNYVDKGLEYLEEVKEQVKRMPKKARSEQPLSRQNDNMLMSEIKNGSVMSNASQMKSKIDYMSEIRSKFNLDKKTSNLKEWERISRMQHGVDPLEKKKNLLRLSKKLDDEAKHQELMYHIQKGSKQGSIFTVEDVQNREKIDELYLESIKAKLAIFDSYHQNQNSPTNQTQPEYSREHEFSVLSQN